VPLGLSTLFLVIQKKGFESVSSLLASPEAEGVSYFEIVDNGSLRLSDATASALSGMVQTGFRFTVHSPYEHVNIASPDARKRRASIDAVKKSMEHASLFEALNVVVHPGCTEDGSTPEEASALNSESLVEIWDHSRSLGQRMAVENDIPRDGGVLVSPDDFRNLFSTSGVRFPMLLDVGHAHMSNTLDSFVRSLASDLVELHVHDNKGERDEHLAIGAGTVDFSKINSLFLNTSLLFTVESVHDAIASYRRLSALRKAALLV
jgi:sugar phosphate isomerase/epimerase